MKISEMFPSKYLKAEEIASLPPVLTITAVQMESMPDGSLRPVLSFREVAKGLVCNKTRCNALKEISRSDESNLWVGHRISLAVGKESFKGDRVDSIRIEPVRHSPLAAAQAVPTDSDIPF